MWLVQFQRIQLWIKFCLWYFPLLSELRPDSWILLLALHMTSHFGVKNSLERHNKMSCSMSSEMSEASFPRDFWLRLLSCVDSLRSDKG